MSASERLGLGPPSASKSNTAHAPPEVPGKAPVCTTLVSSVSVMRSELSCSVTIGFCSLMQASGSRQFSVGNFGAIASWICLAEKSSVNLPSEKPQAVSVLTSKRKIF